MDLLQLDVAHELHRDRERQITAASTARRTPQPAAAGRRRSVIAIRSWLLRLRHARTRPAH
jgi:hypothetical protein